MATYLDLEHKIKFIQEDIISAQVRHNIGDVATLQKNLDKEVSKILGKIKVYYGMKHLAIFIENIDGFPYGIYISIPEMRVNIMECGCDQ